MHRVTDNRYVRSGLGQGTALPSHSPGILPLLLLSSRFVKAIRHRFPGCLSLLSSLGLLPGWCLWSYPFIARPGVWNSAMVSHRAFTVSRLTSPDYMGFPGPGPRKGLGCAVFLPPIALFLPPLAPFIIHGSPFGSWPSKGAGDPTVHILVLAN